MFLREQTTESNQTKNQGSDLGHILVEQNNCYGKQTADSLVYYTSILKVLIDLFVAHGYKQVLFLFTQFSSTSTKLAGLQTYQLPISSRCLYLFLNI